MTRELPSADELRTLLSYDPQTGLLTWLPREGDAAFNGQFANQPAFRTVNHNGYLRGGIGGVSYLAHRVIWKMITGEDPKLIDHINGDRADNRIGNLRSVAHSENSRNAKRRASNTSGVNGVNWDSRRSCWVARIWRDGKRVQIGQFASLESAASARKKAEKLYGYHPNHGRAA